ncbi:MAG: F0F1 ATP synthase subunit alpha [Candidatus Cloacimonetes bacterium]|nr:F0F1 ATP synthase subunit alpha [Candidatus Cloacimonadota bacterium]
MQVKPEEITKIIKEQIQGYESGGKQKSVGYVTTVADGIVSIYGLEDAMVGELLEFPNDIYGMVLNLDPGSVGCALMGDFKRVREGDEVKSTGQVMSVPVGPELLGRVVNPLGQPIDGKGPIATTKTRPVEKIAAGIIERKHVHEPMQTGIKAIDAMVPVGRGQRELIIGDRQTGKTAVAVDTIINQKDTGVISVYVAIGQKMSTVANVVRTLEEHDALKNTIIVASSGADPAPLTYLAPFAGITMAEEFMYENNGACLIVYDDLSKHAVAYREMSLLLKRPPGREAYPGDVFYLHSRLLERAVKLSDDLGAGSITALPIIETQASDVSAYIPTNVISITDGQIYLNIDLFNSGQRPAIDVGLSVSRVGGDAQIKAYKKVAGTLRLDLAQYRELAAFAQFGSDLDEATQKQLARGERTLEILKQGQYVPLHVGYQTLSVYAVTSGLLDEIPVTEICRFEEEYHEYVGRKYSSLAKDIEAKKEMTSDLKTIVDKSLSEFKQEFLAKLN